MSDFHEKIAKSFHTYYELLAPLHGYETKKSSRVPWDELPAPLADMMIATVVAVCESEGVVDGDWFRDRINTLSTEVSRLEAKLVETDKILAAEVENVRIGVAEEKRLKAEPCPRCAANTEDDRKRNELEALRSTGDSDE